MEIWNFALEGQSCRHDAKQNCLHADVLIINKEKEKARERERESERERVGVWGGVVLLS